jgi:glutathione S-transferase
MEPVLFIIHGACSFGSQVALEWSKQSYKIGITTPEIRASNVFRQINPTGKVGALKDGSHVISENLAILLYIADKYPNSDMCPPCGSNERVKVYQWLSYLSSTLHPAFSQASYPSRFINESNESEFRKYALERLLAVLDYVNKYLAEGIYFIIDKPTIVDAQAYGLLRWISRLNEDGIGFNNFPNIAKFMSLMEKNSAINNSLAIENSQPNNLVNSNFAGYFSFE